MVPDLLVHYWFNNKLPISFFNFLLQENRRNTDNAQSTLHVTRPRTKFTSNLPKHKYPIVWNSIPLCIRTTVSRTSFTYKRNKSILEEYVFNNRVALCIVLIVISDSHLFHIGKCTY